MSGYVGYDIKSTMQCSTFLPLGTSRKCHIRPLERGQNLQGLNKVLRMQAINEDGALCFTSKLVHELLTTEKAHDLTPSSLALVTFRNNGTR